MFLAILKTFDFTPKLSSLDGAVPSPAPPLSDETRDLLSLFVRQAVKY